MVDPRRGRGTLTVAIAGASGFVGRALVPALAEHHVIALGRSEPSGLATRGADVEFRPCDLFSLLDAERGLEGVDIAVYLVHSMLSGAHLTQGRFEDLDLICADNFARAAAKAGVRRIVYLGGLLPENATSASLSRHLRSRLEVEAALGAYGVPVTTLRAGIILGAGGSSCQMFVRLVQRLPVMVCPRWTRSLTQPVALGDVVALLRHVILDDETRGRTYDVGCPDAMTYAELLQRTARVLGRKLPMLVVPWYTPRLSLWWVSAFSGYPPRLVFPLVESARHDLVARNASELRARAGLRPTSFEDGLRIALRDEGAAPDVGERASLPPRPPRKSAVPTVRSVQRLPLPEGWTARRVAAEYAAWLPTLLRPFLRVTMDPLGVLRFWLRPLRTPLLELTLSQSRSEHDRQLFYITGGLLARAPDRPRGRLEFRVVVTGHLLAAIHDYVPTLPWILYTLTQARAHLWVMAAFARHLAAAARGAKPQQPTTAFPMARSTAMPEREFRSGPLRLGDRAPER